MMNKQVLLAVCIALISFEIINAQQSWTNKIEPPKRFIENKSQFDGRNELTGSQILFGVDWGATQIFFTKIGLTFRLDKVEAENPYEERQRELARAQKAAAGKEFTRKEDEEREIETDVIHMAWLESNSSVEVIGLEVSEDYFSYTVSIDDKVQNFNHIKGYKRLLYKNLYPNIDAEYEFHPQQGIKYKLILHPGSDISKVKMKYSGGEVHLDETGNARITTKFGDITDHAPVTFFEKKEKRIIPSRYIVADNTISFELEDYNKNKTVILDPWTLTPTLPSSNKAYYVKADGSGNVYVYGGETPYRLLKYSSTGALVWTYNSSWNSSNWFGAMAVDPSGNAFITSGSSAEIARVSPSGSLVWQNASNGALAEYWALSFNCDYTRLFVGGTLVAFPQGFGAAYEVNLNSGAVINTTIVAYQTSDGQVPLPVFNEIRSMTASPNGNYYFLTIDSIGSVNASLNLNYKTSSGYRLSYYLPYGQGGTGQGINGIAATPYFLYTTNGQVLHRRDIITGNILNTVFIPNGSVEVNSGVAVDSCGNVYVGSVGAVHKYDGNLNFLLSASTPAQVYDVAVNSNGEVVACGSGFVASLNMSACKQQKAICDPPFPINMSQTNVLCNGECNGTATATPSGGTPPYTYSWNNGQNAQTATNLCAGVHLVTVTDAVGSLSIASAVITEPPVLSVSVTAQSTTCGASALATPVSGVAPFDYLWSNGATAAEISGLATGTYSVTITDGNNCTANGSVSVVQSPGLTATATSTESACGSCDGTATVTTSMGTPPFTYQWSNGDTTQTATGLCPDIYNVTVTEASGGGTSAFWSEDFSNGNSGWTMNINGPGTNGSAPNRWVVNSNRDAGCPQCPVSGSGGNYLHVTCDSASFFCAPMGGPSCIYSQGFPFLYNNATDKFVSSPNISTVGKSNITLSFWYICSGDAGKDYGLVRLSNDGGTTWTDLPTQYSGVLSCQQAIINVPAGYEGIPNFRIGFRWVNDNDMNGDDPPFLIDDIEMSAPVAPCASIATVIVNSANGPVVTIDSVTNASCKSSADGAVDISVTAGNPPYDYQWTSGDTIEDISGLTSGTYTVSVTDSLACISIQQATVTEPVAIFTNAAITNAGCTVGGAIDVSVSGGTPPYTYEWTNGNTTQDLSNVQGGAYELTVTDMNGCLKVSVFTVPSPGIFLTLNATNATCGGANNGAIASTVLGGAPPYQYNWSNGGSSALIDSLPQGNYTVTVSDNSGCTATGSAAVDAPSVMTFSASITRALCFAGNNGGIKLNPLGGTLPYEVDWNNGDTVLSLENLAPGIYVATVTDAAGCTKDTAIALTSVSEYSVDIVATNASCDGVADGSADANLNSATTPPFTFLWSNGATTSSISNVLAGTYSVTVTDSLSCLRSDTVVVGTGGLVINSEITHATCPDIPDGAIVTMVSGGTPSYNYVWSNGANSSSLPNIVAGTYTLVVTDQNNCSGADTMVVLTDTTGTINCDSLIIYDIFSPNGDGVNDVWIINGLTSYPENEIQIFNRWGNVVFEAKPYNNDWNGDSKNGNPLPSAAYYYILKLNDADKKVYSGAITLVR